MVSGLRDVLIDKTPFLKIQSIFIIISNFQPYSDFYAQSKLKQQSQEPAIILVF